MREVKLGPAAAVSDPRRRVVAVGVFHVGGRFIAYENVCPHMGGPVCQGIILPRVEEDIASDRKALGLSFSKSQTNIVCPWHGYEFDLATGRHQGNQRLRLKAVPV